MVSHFFADIHHPKKLRFAEVLGLFPGLHIYVHLGFRADTIFWVLNLKCAHICEWMFGRFLFRRGYCYSEWQVLWKTLNWSECNFRPIFPVEREWGQKPRNHRLLPQPSRQFPVFSLQTKLRSGQILTFHHGKCTAWLQTFVGLLIDCLCFGWRKG